MEYRKKAVLSIAGSDCSGGAGIQADLKTMLSLDVYGMSVITALTAQNTLGIKDVLEADAEFIRKQMDCIFIDIPPAAVKIGMVYSAKAVETIAERLEYYGVTHLVIDPVMCSSTGTKLLKEDAEKKLIQLLLPMAELITPNLQETEIFCGHLVQRKEEMEQCAEELYSRFHTQVLIKGGHLEGCADDLLYTGSKKYWFSSKKIDNKNTHGTGCTLSSAIACGLAKGYTVEDSVRMAKEYISGAIACGLSLGAGSGPLDHGWRMLS